MHLVYVKGFEVGKDHVLFDGFKRDMVVEEYDGAQVFNECTNADPTAG